MNNKEIYNSVYDLRNVTLVDTDRYSTSMNLLRQEIVAKYSKGNDVLDAGCGIGEFLIPHLNDCKSAVGLDFSTQYLEEFSRRVGDCYSGRLILKNADLREFPLRDNSVDFAFSFSTLYYIEQIGEVISEFGRVLRSGGVAALEFGNKNSLNTIISAYRHANDNWAKSYNHCMKDVFRLLGAHEFEVMQVRRFQVLPLLTVPRSLFWLYPFTGNVFRNFLSRHISGGRIVDEVISGAPLLRNFAFRNMVIVRRK